MIRMGALTKKQKRDLQQDTKRRQVLKLEPLGNGSDPIREETSNPKPPVCQ